MWCSWIAPDHNLASTQRAVDVLEASDSASPYSRGTGLNSPPERAVACAWRPPATILNESLGAVVNFRFFDLQVYVLADPQGAVAEVKGEGLIKSTGRMYLQDYVVFLRAADGKIAFLREYFDPVRAARALHTPVSAFNPSDKRGAPPRALSGPDVVAS
jgi:hypothetical protein